MLSKDELGMKGSKPSACPKPLLTKVPGYAGNSNRRLWRLVPNLGKEKRTHARHAR